MADLFTTDQTDQTQIDPSKNYYEELVGENKKFKDNEALAKSKAQSDLYINHLTDQLDQLREDYTKLDAVYKAGPKVEEIVEQLQSRLASSNTPPANEETTPPPALDLSQIEGLVAQKLTQHELAKKQQENFNNVKAKLIEHYGESYSSVLKQQVESLGLTDSFVNDLAHNHPQVLYKTLGLEGTPNRENYQAPPRSTTNSKSNVAPKKRTWAYWQEVRKNDPKAYHDPKNVVQRLNDGLELGEAFKDGDWSSYRT